MKIVKNYIYNLSYQVFMLLIPVVTLPYISRVLGAKGIGINAYTYSIVSYFILFGNLGVSIYGNQLIARVRKDKKKLTSSFWEINLLRLISLVLTTIIYFWVSVNQQMEIKTALYAQLPMLVAGVFDISWFFMGMEEFQKIFLRNISVKLIGLLAIYLFVKTPSDVNVYILILSGTQLLGNLALWFGINKYLDTIQIKPKNILFHLIPSISYLAPQIAIQIYVVVNRTLLGSIVGFSETGYYENADKIIRIVLSLVTATGVVMLPRMANEIEKGNHKLVSKFITLSFGYSSFIAYPTTFGLIMVSKDFSYLFFGDKFEGIEQAIRLLALIIIPVSWSNVIGQQYLLPTNDIQGYTKSVSIGAMINILLNIYLIPKFGLFGAIIGTVIAEYSVTVVQLFHVSKSLKSMELVIGSWKNLFSSLLMVVAINMVPNDLRPFTSLITKIIFGGGIYLSVDYILKDEVFIFIVENFKKIRNWEGNT